MRIMLRAAIAAVSFASVGPAHADGGTVAKVLFTEIAGAAAQTPPQSDPVAVTAPDGRAVHAYASDSRRGTWLFPPHQEGGGVSG
jgi:hypothetical protein